MINVITHYFSSFILPLIFLIFGIRSVLKKNKWKRVFGFCFIAASLALFWSEMDSISLNQRLKFFQNFDGLAVSNIKEILVAEIEPKGLEKKIVLGEEKGKLLSFLKNARPIYVLSPMFGEGKQSYNLSIMTKDSVVRYDFLIREQEQGSYIYMKMLADDEANTIAQYATEEDFAW